MSTNNKKSNVDEVSIYRMKKLLKIVAVLAVIILIIEAIIFLVIKNNRENSITYYESFESVLVLDDESRIVVGNSDFSKSDNYEYTGGYQKGLFIKYDKDGKVELEIQYDRGNNSTFKNVLKVEDGYIIVGSCEYTDYQTENKIRTAIILKYDFYGNKIWEHSYEVRSDTRFNDLILTEDKKGLIVIGQSIYEAMEVGNHTDGGGIILKYDLDGNEIWHNNHGGNKSGNFNSVIEVNGDFYVVGKDASDSGNLIKYNKNGEYQWHKNYSYTDSLGLLDLVYKDNYLYALGSKKILDDNIDIDLSINNRNTKNTDILIIKYDMKGNVKEEKTFGGTSFERGIKIDIIDNNFYIFGMSSSSDSVLPVNQDIEYKYGSMVALVYDEDLEYISGKVIGGSHNDILTGIYYKDSKFYLSGYSNSKDGDLKDIGNGRDYNGVLISIDKNLDHTEIK